MSGSLSLTLKETWKTSRWFRVLLVAAFVWFVFRLAMQLILLFDPAWNQGQLGNDLRLYLNAARHFLEHTHLYLQGSLKVIEEQFSYAPAFALLIIPFSWLPVQVNFVISVVIHLAAYILLFLRWDQIFRKLGLDRAARLMVWSLPVWLVFSAFWDDLTYLNIYTILPLVATFLIEAILEEKPLPAALCLTFILLTKPHWAFAAALPLFFKQYRLFLHLLLWTVVFYAGITLVTFLAGGPAYIWEQYREYFAFLARFSRDFPWRTLSADGFLGYNHSTLQIVLFFAGATTFAFRAANLAKFILLVPLLVIATWRVARPARPENLKSPLALELAFLAYLGAFLWLDMVWEVFLAIVIFVYLLAVLQNRLSKFATTIVFLLYAVIDIWRVLIFAAGSPDIQGAYLAWDYSMYFPIILVVILLFYSILAIRAWPARQPDQ